MAWWRKSKAQGPVGKRNWEVSMKEGAQAYVAQGRSSGGVESLKN